MGRISTNNEKQVNKSSTDKQPANLKTVVLLGVVRPWSDLSKVEVGFLVLAMLTLVSLTSIYLLRALNAANDFWVAYAILSFFILTMALLSVLKPWSGNLCFFIGGLIPYAIYSVSMMSTVNSHSDLEKAAKLVGFIVIGTLVPLTIGVAVYLAFRYLKLGDFLDRLVGRDRALRAAAERLFSCHLHILIDFYAQVLFIAFIFMFSERSSNLWAVLSLSVGVPLMCLWSLCLYLFIRFEWATSSHIWLRLGILQPVFVALSSSYVVFKTCSLEPTTNMNTTSNGTDLKNVTFFAHFGGLLIIVGLAIVFRIALIMMSTRVCVDFGKGLRQRLYPDRKKPLINGEVTSGTAGQQY